MCGSIAVLGVGFEAFQTVLASCLSIITMHDIKMQCNHYVRSPQLLLLTDRKVDIILCDIDLLRVISV